MDSPRSNANPFDASWLLILEEEKKNAGVIEYKEMVAEHHSSSFTYAQSRRCCSPYVGRHIYGPFSPER